MDLMSMSLKLDVFSAMFNLELLCFQNTQDFIALIIPCGTTLKLNKSLCRFFGDTNNVHLWCFRGDALLNNVH